MIETKIKNRTNLIQELSLSSMALASVFGAIELPAHYLRDSILPVAKFAVAETVSVHNQPPTSMQREKSETSEMTVSYSETQRTPGRTGNA